ncbi:MAG: sigma-70 family RNA polymerase sigma factor [Planctomycetota bacterium]
MNEASFQSFLCITENRSRILAMIVSMVHDFDLAEELFQETVVEILKSEDSFDPACKFLPWACGVARNVVLRHWRLKKKAPTNGLSSVLAELAEVAIDGDDDAWRRDRVALRRCFQRLTPRMQKLLLLRYGHNIKGQKLSSAAEIRTGSIRTTLFRLRGQLRQCIETQMAQS